MNDHKLTITVYDSARDAALRAIAFLQLAQTEKVTVEIDDDAVKVHLDDGYLSYPFDASEGMYDKEVWYVGYNSNGMSLTSWLDEHYPEGGDDGMELDDEIGNALAELASFAYHAAGAAISTLNFKEQTT